MQDLSPSLDKLSPRSFKCVFMEYSITQKRYRCYDLTTRRYFTSIDVTFFEFTRYFASISSTDVQATVPLPITVESSIVEGTSSTSGASIAPPCPLQVYTCRLRE